MPLALSVKKRHVSHRAALIGDMRRAQGRLMAGMGAKRSAAAACLLTALCCLCSVSWAQTTNEQLCEALDITSNCPIFSTSRLSSANWLVSTTTSGATGGKALRSGAISEVSGISVESCLVITLQRPVRVAFRWRVSSEARHDRLFYIDAGQSIPAPSVAISDMPPLWFISGNTAWRDASFDYPGSGPVKIEWCYIKDDSGSAGEDAGYLDRLRITSLLSSVVALPSQVQLSEGSSATLTLSLDETPQSNATVKLTVPTESAGDIAISPAQVVLSPGQPTMTVTITAKEDNETELGETHIVRAQSPVALATTVIVIISPEPILQAPLCAALDITSDCPIFSASDDSSAVWSVIADSAAIGSEALRSGMIDDIQRSCLSAILQRPVRVAFRWRVSSVNEGDYLHYIDDGRRIFAPPVHATGDKFLSGEIAWRDASFDYPGSGLLNIEWCYIKDGVTASGDDAGYLDRLQITSLLADVVASPSQVSLSEGGDATFTLSLDMTPQSNVTVKLTVPTESAGDITVSPAQVVLSPGQPTMTVTIAAIKDNNVEVGETHIVRAQSLDSGMADVTAVIFPDPLPQAPLCAALDITSDCPTFSTGDGSSSIWSASTKGDPIGDTALRSGMIGHNQRSCLRTTLQRPARVAFRWRVSSEALHDRLHYIDDGRRSHSRPSTATGAKFLSGNVAWRDTSFDYPGNGPVDIEWCYIKDNSTSGGEDAGYLDRLRITRLLSNVVVSSSRVELLEGSSATLTLSLDETPQSNVVVELTVPTESINDIAVSPAQVVLSPGQPTASITISASEDNNLEPKETHIVRVRGPTVVPSMITVITLPDLPLGASLCAALDIGEEGCPTFSTSDDSSSFWSASTVSGATGGMALRSGMIGHDQRSCLSATLQRPVRVAFRWRVSSQAGLDRLHYIDDGRRSPAIPAAATGDKFLSGEVVWRDASFDYLGDGPVDIEWCYIKNPLGDSGEDAGFLDRLRITELLGSLTAMPSQVELPEGGSATLTLSLDETPRSNVTVKLTVPTESAGDIAVSPAQVILSPGQPTMTATIRAIEDYNVEPRETHAVNAQSPVAVSTVITVITPLDPPPSPASLCAILDINEGGCPTFSTGDGSSTFWLISAVDGAAGGTALHSGMIGDNQRSCLSVTLQQQRPVRVSFRWRVSSQEGADYLHYIDDGRRSPMTGGVATSDRFLSGDVAWRDASFDYLGDGDVDIEWCYIKDGSGDSGDDAGFLDRLRITELLGGLTVTPSQVLLPEGSSAALTLSLDTALESNATATVKLTAPTESAGDIIVSPAQVILSAGQSTAPITVAAIEDDDAEARETHTVHAQSPVAVSTMITIITSPDPLPQDSLCAALDITSDCPTFSTGDDSSSIWSASTKGDPIGDTALRSGMIGHNQRSCLRTTLQRPARVAFRWRVDSQQRADYLHYIDDGQLPPARPTAVTGAKFLSGNVESWRDASFEYPDSGPIDIQWCYIKNGSGVSGDDAGFLDRLRITELLGSLTVTPSQVLLSEGGNATLTLSLDTALESNATATVRLTAPAESANDIAVSPAQVILRAGQSTAPIVVTAIEDDNAEVRETHTVNAQSPVAVSTMITVITSPDPLPQDSLCAALDIGEEDCPTLLTGDDSSAVWSPSTVSGAIGGVALRSGAIDHNQRSCLRAAIRGPASVSFRWRVSSQQRADYLHYIDDGRLPPARPTAATGAKFLSGNVESWRDASFEYPEGGPIDIQWCYIKNGSGVSGDDAGFLDRLQITQPSSSINLKVRVYLEGALQ